jgi:hypothetical protein
MRGAGEHPPALAVVREVHTAVTAGRPSQAPHCPARTCTENAQPGADGLNGSGSRAVGR